MMRLFGLRASVGLLILGTLLAGAAAPSHAHHMRMAKMESPPRAAPTVPKTAPSENSLHQLDAAWTNQHGQTVQLGDFSGRIVILAMVYTSCEYACPRIIADMRRIRAAFPDSADQIAFVLASIDPKHDSVAHLAKFGGETGLSEQGWTLMRADESTVRELAAVLGVQYRPTSATDFAHSNIISVINTDGELTHQQTGLGSAPDATIQAIQQLLAQP